MQIKANLRRTGMIFLCMAGLFGSPIQAAEYQVLVVMSYEQINPWCLEIKAGIDSALGDRCEVTYFYMDTKVNLEGGDQKAKDAYDLYQRIRPHGIITADDNAQSMFVLPYLMGQSTTPIMFCGVNAEAGKYGYPTPTISGILERGHIRESIAFLKQLSPSVQTFGVLTKLSPSGRALLSQVESEDTTYPVKANAFKLVSTMKELVSITKAINAQCDAIYIDSLEGIVDEKGNPLKNEEIIPVLAKCFGKPIVGANQYHVIQGALCAVVKTGQEQGATAAKMLLKAMQGTPPSEIPITQNYKGKRVINVAVMEALGLQPKPMVLLGAELVRTQP